MGEAQHVETNDTVPICAASQLKFATSQVHRCEKRRHATWAEASSAQTQAFLHDGVRATYLNSY